MRETEIIENLFKVLVAATPEEFVAGAQAYGDYTRVMRDVAKRFELSTPVVTGVFCALSPNNNWMANLRSAVTVCHAFVNGWPENETPVTTYNKNRDKAFRILRGEAIDHVFKGRKVLSFYDNIAYWPDSKVVTVDGHMANAARGKPLPLVKSGLTNREYGIVEDCTILLNKLLSVEARVKLGVRGLSPCDLQAVVWLTWKRMHSLAYAEGLYLFPEVGLSQYVDSSKMEPYTRAVPVREQEPSHEQMGLSR